MGVTGAGISINGPSGIDTASIVDQLTALEQQNVTTVQNQAAQYQVQINAYSQLKSNLANVQTAVNALNSNSAFDVFTPTSSDSTVVTLQGGVGAVEGQYDISVSQLATSEKMISKDNLITNQSATLLSQGVNVGDISIDGTKITIDAGDTIQDLRSKINAATDASGNPLNVSASVIQINPADFRLVLSAKTTGSTGVDYQDVTGTTFKDLGIISGSTGTATQTVTSLTDFKTGFNALAAGATISYVGTNHGATSIPGSFTKDPNDSNAASLGKFLAQIGHDLGGTALIDATGHLVLTDSTSGSSSIGISSLTTTDAAAAAAQSYPMNETKGLSAVAQQLTSDGHFEADFNLLAANSTIQFSGTDNSGNPVALQTFIKDPADMNAVALGKFLTQIGSSLGGAASIDSSGNLMIADPSPGISKISVGSLDATDAFSSVTASYIMSATTSGSDAVSEQFSSQDSIMADFSARTAGSTFTYTGTATDGSLVNASFTKDPNDSNATATTKFLAQVGVDFKALATLDGGGHIVLTDATPGASALSVASLDYTDAAAQAPGSYLFSTSTAGAQVGNKGNAAQVLQSQDDIQTAFNALGAGAAVQYSGVDHNGNAVTNTYYKTAANTSINDFLTQVNNTFYGEATASIGAGGVLTLTDNQQGASQLAVSSLSIGGVLHTVSTLTAGKAGAGVLTVGKDAYFSMDGLMLKSSTNNADSFISGVTIQLHKADPTESVQTTLAVNSDQIQKNIQAVLDSYNSLLKFAGDETKPADPNDSTTKNGDLVNDMTVSSMVDQVRNTLMQSFNLSGGSYNSLTMLGIKSDPQTGDLSIDQTQFTKAITTSLDQVKRVFVTSGISSNKNITFGRNTSATQSGVYTLTEPDNTWNTMNIQLGGNPSDTSDGRNGDIISFSTGPATGLSITSPAGIIGTGNSATFTFSMGLADQLSNLIDNFNDPSTGIIATHQNSLQDQITDANTRADDLQTRVNDYHDGLVRQFAAMEEALNSMKSQEAQMMSALGGSVSSTSSTTST